VTDRPNPLAENLERVRRRMAEAARQAGRRPDEVFLVAVSKTVDPARILEALRCGVLALGENRVQEARDKWPVLEAEMRRRGAEFHLVGHLQTNKAKDAVRLFDLIQSLDSERLAVELDRRAAEIGKVQRVLIEVNTSGELTKFGVEPGEAALLIETVRSLKALQLEGLMTIGPLGGGPEAARRAFRTLRELREANGGPARLPVLSMGMTQDFEAAIAEGATMIRVGTALFGDRG